VRQLTISENSNPTVPSEALNHPPLAEEQDGTKNSFRESSSPQNCMRAIKSRELLTDPESFSHGKRICFSFGIPLSKRWIVCEISSISMGMQKTGKPQGPANNSTKCAFANVFESH